VSFCRFLIHRSKSTVFTLYSCGRYSMWLENHRRISVGRDKKLNKIVLVMFIWVGTYILQCFWFMIRYDPYCQIVVFILCYIMYLRCRNTWVRTLLFAILYPAPDVLCAGSFEGLKLVLRRRRYVFIFFPFWFFHLIKCPFSLATDRSAADLNYN